jgi:hypothetical protein
MDDALCTTRERVAAALHAYYRQADCFQLTAQELLDWYKALSPQAQGEVTSLSPYHWSVLPQFKRYALENRGYRLQEYLIAYLTPDELAYWGKNYAASP